MSKTIKGTVYIFLAAVILLFCLGSCSSGKTLTEKNNGDNVVLHVNDTLEIKLESNPTTGYSWFLSGDVDSSIASVTGPGFIEAKKDGDVVGAGGHEVFTIKATGKGQTSIKLNYERPWEEEEEPIETFEVTITVN